jgi:hypothetical protein
MRAGTTMMGERLRVPNAHIIDLDFRARRGKITLKKVSKDVSEKVA